MVTLARGVVALLGVWLALVLPGVAAASEVQTPPHALLDVPYLAQTPALCGGAALAMVLRYWGVRDVLPQDFAALVGDGGILTGALRSAVTGRGWQAHVLDSPGEAATRIQVDVDQGRPLIALIEVSPGAYHYVVVVAVTDDAVVVHDPALAPFRVLPWPEFETAWAAAGRWILRVLPPDGFSPAAPPIPPSRTVAAERAGAAALETPCAALVARSVRHALAGDGDGAGRGLEAAARLCPADPSSRRELAGLRFAQRRWPEAEALAVDGVGLDPSDAYTWKLLATTRHLMGNTAGALAAWNRVDEPRIDTVDVHGAVRTRHPAVVRTLRLEPRSVLTPATFGRARHRLRALPGVLGAELRYAPLDGGRVRVDAFIDERPVLPRGWVPLSVMAARALLLRETAVDVPMGLGAGERAQLLWRWAARRPRVALGVALPAPKGMPGVLTVDGAWERQSYAHLTPSSASPFTEDRRRVAAHLSDWATRWLHWQAGAGLDGWSLHGPDGGRTSLSSREFVAVEGGLEVRLAGDRLAMGGSGGWWVPLASPHRFRAGAFRVAWRSTPDAARPSWSFVTVLAGASAAAPFGVWPGAGAGPGRDGLLRAHPLLRDGVLDGPAFGRLVPRGSLVYTRPLRRTRPMRLAVAGFADVARAWHRQSGTGPSPLFVDAGAGLRVQAPGGGSVRVDVARGLRGGGTVISAGWDEAWPR